MTNCKPTAGNNFFKKALWHAHHACTTQEKHSKQSIFSKTKVVNSGWTIRKIIKGGRGGGDFSMLLTVHECFSLNNTLQNFFRYPPIPFLMARPLPVIVDASIKTKLLLGIRIHQKTSQCKRIVPHEIIRHLCISKRERSWWRYWESVIC